MDGLAGAREPDSHASLHAIEVEGSAELFAAHHVHRRAGARRHEHLWFDPRYLYVSCVGDVSGQRAGRHTESVSVELTTLEALPDDVDDAVERHGLTVRQRRLRDNEVVELQSLALSNADPEFQWGRVLRSEHETHDRRR